MKIDCSKTENFFKELNRRCEATDCKDCKLSEDNNGSYSLSCDSFMRFYRAEAIEIVQKWSDEHPIKTLADDFKEKYPNAPMKKEGEPLCCPYYLGYDGDTRECNFDSCYDCWNRAYEG